LLLYLKTHPTTLTKLAIFRLFLFRFCKWVSLTVAASL
jgi:hypothetical protein